MKKKERGRRKRFLAGVLSLCMVLTMTPVQGRAAESLAKDSEDISGHYDANGFCTGYELKSDGTWGKKEEEDACTEEGCSGYQPADLTTGKYDIDGDGSKDEVYEIGNAGQLYWFAGLINGDESVCTDGVTQNYSANAVLTADIIVNENVLKEDGTLSEDTSGFRSWTPIGGAWANYYKGIFDGQSHTISGLYFSNSDADYVGLFHTTEAGAVISHVGIKDSYFYGRNYVSAMCGRNSGTVTDCYNAGSVKGRVQHVSGVCGFNKGGTIRSSYNTGTVTAGGGFGAGGVCGWNKGGTIRSSYNTGKVTASGRVGGVCELNSGTDSGSIPTITGSYNTGEVTVTGSDGKAGGVCGENDGAITNSYNTGEVTGTGSGCKAGGVCGYNDKGTLSNSYSAGKLTVDASDGVAGGVCGTSEKTISNCYFDSTIYSGDAVGSGSGTATATVGKTNAQFAGGEVAYLLNEGKTDGSQAWYQNIDNGETKDGIPVLDSKHGIVYKSAPCPIKYSNSDEEVPHSFKKDSEDDTRHICEKCGHSEKHADIATFTVNPEAHSISAHCSSCGDLGTITLSAADAVYDGKDKAASVSSTIKGIITPSIVYERKNGEAYTKIDGFPREVGIYRAGITVSTGANAATVNVDYEITKVPTVIAETPDASAITYGDTLADSALTGGKVICRGAEGNELAGTFSWKDGSIKPTVFDSGETEYDVIFTPEDSVNYNTVETSVTLTVNKAAKAPKMPDDVMKPAHNITKVGEVTLPENWSWLDEDKDTVLDVNVSVTATAVYNGADKGNYEKESVNITLTRKECDQKNTVVKNQIPATCTTGGYSGDTYCVDCGALIKSGMVTDKLEHTYSIPKYTWKNDAAEKMTCTASKSCTRTGCAETEADHSITETVTAKEEVTKESTCTAQGTKTYTAVFTKGGFTTQTKTEEMAVIDHTLTAVKAKEATATEPGNKAYFVCDVCGKFFEDSEGTKEITDKTSIVIPARGMTPTPTPGASETPAVIPTTEPEPVPPTTEPEPVPPTTEPSDEVTAQPAGAKIKDSAGTAYKVTESVNGSATVQYAAPASKVKGSVSIPATVTIGKETYKVTSVAANAFKNKKNITCIIIGKNVRKIGKNAFAGCKKLKKIIIKTKKLTKKSVAKGAFRGIGKKVVVQVPKSKYKTYKKLLRAKGLSKKVRVKKGYA